MTAEQNAEIWSGRVSYLKEHPFKVARLHISSEALKSLKNDVYQGKDAEDLIQNICSSTNDCMVAVLYRAFLETAQFDLKIDPKKEHSLVLACNLRCRRQPPVPVSFFGSYVIPLHLKLSGPEWETLGIFGIASKLREKVRDTDEEEIKAFFDSLHMLDGVVQFKTFYEDNILNCSNWNSFFDWYKDADLGQGQPEKMMFLIRNAPNIAFILPSKEESSLEIVLGLEPAHMERFQQHYLIQKYFKV